jgi:hypothetical protein
MNVFNVPKPLLEAIDKVASNSWRRDFDIRPLVLIAGLHRLGSINEVFSGNSSDYDISDTDAGKIHNLLKIHKQHNRISHSIDHYCGSGSVDINHHMWENHVNGSAIPEHIKSHINNIKSALIPSTNIDHIRLFTGIRQSPVTTAGFEWNSSRPIKHLHLPSFTSTSTNFDVASSFTHIDSESVHHESDHHGIVLPHARHVLELNFHGEIPNAASMVGHSGASHEEEVLLGPNHKFELNPRPTLVQHYDDPVYVWKATYNKELLSNKFSVRELR